MDDRKCPLCGGMLLDKVCMNCGYEYLTEEELTAPYDFVPDNDYFGDPEEKSAVEEMETAEADEILQLQTPPVSRHLQNPLDVPINNSIQYTPPPQNVPIFEMVVKDLSNYIQKNWWQILLTFLIPITGYFIGAVYIAFSYTNDSKVAAMDRVTKWAIGAMYIIAAIVLEVNHIDLFGLDKFLMEFMGNLS